MRCTRVSESATFVPAGKVDVSVVQSAAETLAAAGAGALGRTLVSCASEQLVEVVVIEAARARAIGAQAARTARLVEAVFDVVVAALFGARSAARWQAARGRVRCGAVGPDGPIARPALAAHSTAAIRLASGIVRSSAGAGRTSARATQPGITAARRRPARAAERG
jgi:hypothetical protein